MVMKEIIRSSGNRNIKLIRSLHEKKYRDEMDRFVLEGEKLLREALEYNVGLVFVLFGESFSELVKAQELITELESRGIPVYYAEDRIFKGAGETENPQGVIAVAEKQNFDIDSISDRDRVCLLLLDEVRDPGNVGTIIRTADACGIDGVVLARGCADLYNGKTIRSTMGSLFHIPVVQNVDAIETLNWAREKGIVSLGADPRSDMNCIDMPGFRKSIIVIGNEAQGIRPRTMEQLDFRISIPMPGKAESLNAGIAAAIMMYEVAVRRRMQGKV